MSFEYNFHYSSSIGGNLWSECNKSNQITIHSSNNSINYPPIISNNDIFIKAKFAHNKYGLVIGALSQDKNNLFIYKYAKVSLYQSKWMLLSKINLKNIEDFDFMNNSMSNKLKIVVVTQLGKAYIFEASNYSLKTFNMIWNNQVDESSCYSVACNNYEGFTEEFIIGCKGENNNDIMQIYRYDNKVKAYQKMNLQKKKTITDKNCVIIELKIGYQIGTDFYYVCTSMTNGKVIFYKLDTDMKELSFLGGYQSQTGPIINLSWNNNNKIATGYDTKQNKYVFKQKPNEEEFCYNNNF